MISWSDAFSLSLVSASLLSSLLGLWLAATTPGTDRWSKRFFLGYFSVLALCCFATSVEIALQYYPIPDAAVYVALALETLLLSAAALDDGLSAALLWGKLALEQAHAFRNWLVGVLLHPAGE